MSHDPAPAPMPVSTTLAHLRRRKLEATQALLGDTISIPDEDWHAPSRLPGWTRAHVATHLARNADALRRVVLGLLDHRPTVMYPDPAVRRRELERGARRGALELQIDLDTSAGELNRALNLVEEAGITEPVQLREGLWMPVHHLSVLRLDEVVLHRIDLDHGFRARDVDPDIARWLLEWHVGCLQQREDLPALELSSTTGLVARLGDPHRTPRPVCGSDADLLGWLTGRGDARALEGIDDHLTPWEL